MESIKFKSSDEEVEFRRKIEEFYLPKQLVDTIMEIGEIPETLTETEIGVGFIDIANYSFISKFLSPKENQVLLNGLFNVLNHVLSKNGGYLNKIEGDSLMFQYGGLIDQATRKLEGESALQFIARRLFYTCIEMQRFTYLFNKADEGLLDRLIQESATEDTLRSVVAALEILKIIRTDNELVPSTNALYQINIRIGANIGVVSSGNFGPDGAKHFDAIGLPVINAKRMESTAPVGGLRISGEFFKLLDDNGITDEYLNGFRSDALKKNGYYAGISKDELFRFSRVKLKDKRNAEFNSYSVQVNPMMPEDIADQVSLLLDKQYNGADKIVEIMQYYRGNKYIITAIENVLKNKRIRLRKERILETMAPDNIRAIRNKFPVNDRKLAVYIDRKFSLYDLLKLLGEYQDFIKRGTMEEEMIIPFIDYTQYVEEQIDFIETKFEMKQKFNKQRAMFYEIIFPKIFLHLKASIIEYQHLSLTSPNRGLQEL